MAPNPRGDFLSLATCKPVIRRCAREGDWVVANRGSPRNDEVVWAGRISEILPVANYSSKYPSRDDALYRHVDGGGSERIPGKHVWYHRDKEQQMKDRRDNVLIFDWKSVWYFGEQSQTLPDDLTHLIAYGQGHRVNGAQQNDEGRLKAWLASLHAPGRISSPADGWEGPQSQQCSNNKSRRTLTISRFKPNRCSC